MSQLCGSGLYNTLGWGGGCIRCMTSRVGDVILSLAARDDNNCQVARVRMNYAL